MVEDTTHENPLSGIEIVTAGFLAGLVGGIGMGIVLYLGPNIFEILGALAGSSTAVAGWFVHLTLSIAFGIAFAVIVSRRTVAEYVRSFEDFVGAGIAFGTVLGLLAGGFILPLAVAQAGVGTLPLPFLPLPSGASELLGAAVFAVGHLVYGLLVGATIAAISGAVPSRTAGRTTTHN